MIVDLVGASLFFAIGVVVGLNWFSLSKKRTRLNNPMATRDPDHFLYGKHKMAWFWMRQYDEDEGLRRLPLRKYAKLKSGT